MEQKLLFFRKIGAPAKSTEDVLPVSPEKFSEIVS